MPNIKSAKKRVLVNDRRKVENRGKKSELNTVIRKFREAVNKEPKKAATMLDETVSKIDSAVNHGVITKNSANNKKSKLANALNKALATINE